MIRDGHHYVVPDVVWTDPDGDCYAAHVIRRGRDSQGVYVLIEFEDEEGTRRERVHPSRLEELR